MKTKTVLIYSGGLDSTVLLAHLLNEDREVHALSVYYGQRHARELDAARDITSRIGVDHQIVDLACLRPLLGGSSQTDPSIPVPHGHYEEESMKLTVVPNRNMLLMAVAGAWAVSLKADSLTYAAHGGDHAVYPDCREEFCRPMGEAFQNCDWHPVALERPFLNITKSDIVKLGAGNKLGFGTPVDNLTTVDLMAMSYSCYEGDIIHCGKCGTCVERREAFKLAGVTDLTPYKD